MTGWAFSVYTGSAVNPSLAAAFPASAIRAIGAVSVSAVSPGIKAYQHLAVITGDAPPANTVGTVEASFAETPRTGFQSAAHTAFLPLHTKFRFRLRDRLRFFGFRLRGRLRFFFRLRGRLRFFGRGGGLPLRRGFLCPRFPDDGRSGFRQQSVK